MPPNHQAYQEWSPERFTRWAQTIGPHTTQLVQAILASRQHPQQAYRSCLGLLRLASRYGAERLEAACRLPAVGRPACNSWSWMTGCVIP